MMFVLRKKLLKKDIMRNVECERTNDARVELLEGKIQFTTWRKEERPSHVIFPTYFRNTQWQSY